MANHGAISINISQDTDDHFGEISIEQENQFDVKIEQESNVSDIDIDIIDGVSGMDKIIHDGDFSGEGTEGDPLTLSEEFYEKFDDKQEKLTAGPGIEISEDNVISITNSYVHEQGVASDTWVINHNLGHKPNVVVIDTANNVVEASVHYDSLNTCTVETKYAFKGTAYLN